LLVASKTVIRNSKAVSFGNRIRNTVEPRYVDIYGTGKICSIRSST